MYVVCGNKNDVGRRAVTTEEGRAFAARRGLKYFETSAKEGTNVDVMFEALFDSLAGG